MARKASKKLAPRPSLRGRIWVEIDGTIALTEAGADLLEQIEATKSLSEAARRLRFGYRRAWMLVDGMNRRWQKPLVKTATGGTRGGGSRLTELGREVLRGYRDVQIQVEASLDRATTSFAAAIRVD